jgi:IS30 family transposase
MPYQHLSRKERGKIALFANQKLAVREIARRIGRNPSTISRELRRNQTDSRYRADDAEQKHRARREKSRRKKLYERDEVVKYVTEKLLLCWSPEQIAGRLKLEKLGVSVSFASIYRWLNEGLLPRAVELKPKLRHFRKRKRPKKMTTRNDAKTIHQRAKSILRRERFGDWEVDTISFGGFPNQAYILAANERKSRYTAMILLKNIKRETVMRAFELIFEDKRLPLKTMTSDRGMEFNCHNEFEVYFGADYYYADKGKPYQKPTIENMNGLIRQFLPKGTQIRELPSERIPEIVEMLNNRPRKTLGFRTPTEVLQLG